MNLYDKKKRASYESLSSIKDTSIITLVFSSVKEVQNEAR